MFAGKSAATLEIDSVIPAKAGIQEPSVLSWPFAPCHLAGFARLVWIPASAGMTRSASQAGSCDPEEYACKREVPPKPSPPPIPSCIRLVAVLQWKTNAKLRPAMRPAQGVPRTPSPSHTARRHREMKSVCKAHPTRLECIMRKPYIRSSVIKQKEFDVMKMVYLIRVIAFFAIVTSLGGCGYQSLSGIAINGWARAYERCGSLRY